MKDLAMCLLLVTACGSSNPVLPGDPDASTLSVDGAVVGPDAANEGFVTVTVWLGSAQLENVSVVVHDPGGTPRGVWTTDANGAVSVPVTDGDMITVASMVTGPRTRRTVVGVKPGDTFEINVYPDADPSAGQLQATLPGPHAEASFYQLLLGCSPQRTPCLAASPNTDSTFDLDYYPPSLGTKGAVNVLAVATKVGSPVAVSYAKAVVPSGEPTEITLPQWTTDFHRIDVTPVNGNLGDFINLDTKLIVDDTVFTMMWTAGNNPYATFTGVEGFADYVQVGVTIRTGEPPMSGAPDVRHFMGQRVSSNVTNVSVDLADLLPAVLSSSSDTSDVARPEFSWITEAGIETSDAVVVLARWMNGDSWAILQPPSATTVRTPALPDELALFRPLEPAYAPLVVYADSSAFDGYDEIRSVALTLSSGPRFLSGGLETMRGAFYLPFTF